MKAERKTTVKLKFSDEELRMLREVVEKIINGESPLHEIGILTAPQLEFVKKLQKAIA